jgi:hypothetical protein
MIIASLLALSLQMHGRHVRLPLQIGEYVDVDVACSAGSMATSAGFDGRYLGFGLPLGPGRAGNAAVEEVRMLSRGVYTGRITWERGSRVNISVRIRVISPREFVVNNSKRMRRCA